MGSLSVWGHGWFGCGLFFSLAKSVVWLRVVGSWSLFLSGGMGGWIVVSWGGSAVDSVSVSLPLCLFYR